MLRIPATDLRTKSRVAAAGVTPGGRERIRSHSRSSICCSRSVTSCSLGRKVAVDGLFGDLGLAHHVNYSNVLIASLGEQASGSVGDEPPGAPFLRPQSRTGHTSMFSKGTRSLGRTP